MGKKLNGQTLIQAFEDWAPKHLAFEDDRVRCGLQIGTLNKPVEKVMVTLDVLENVVDEAIEKKVDLIIAHHAVIFKPLKDMRTDRGQSKIAAKCIKHDIAVYVAHTNFDIAENGMNDLLAEKIGIENTEILAPTYHEQLYKIAVFVPESHAEGLRTAMGNAGAGYIGDYSHCTFNTPGIGTFTPQEGTNPYIGKQGELEKVDEIKIETITEEKELNLVISKMVKAHPYEEPAYDVYPLNQKGKAYGIGRIGEIASPLSLKDFAAKIKESFGLEGLRVVGNLDEKVQKVAVLGGDGNGFMKTAAVKGADVFITGDIYYHTAHDAILDGLNIIDAGHHIESIMKEAVREYLARFITEKKYETEIIVSEANTNPFTFM